MSQTSQTSSTSKRDGDSDKKKKDKTRTSKYSESVHMTLSHKVTIETTQMKTIYKKMHDRSNSRYESFPLFAFRKFMCVIIDGEINEYFPFQFKKFVTAVNEE